MTGREIHYFLTGCGPAGWWLLDTVMGREASGHGKRQRSRNSIDEGPWREVRKGEMKHWEGK